jgi:alcohol dehydrogenase
MSSILKMPKQVYFGNDCDARLKEYAAAFHKVCVFTDRAILGTKGAQKMLKALADTGAELYTLSNLTPEPSYIQAQETIELFQKTGAELIVAIGGGSVMDIAKLASITTCDGCTVKALLDNPLLGKKTIPTVMIPTTAGTGAEATPNSIVGVPEKALKVGIVNEEMIADVVLLDGDMIDELPASIAAATGVDALCHAVECFTSKKATPFSNLYALEAMRLIFGNLEKACSCSAALEAKNNMLLAAFYGGVAITASGTTAVHALSYPLGGRYHIPHGVSNAIMLMPVMRFNAPACQAAFAKALDAVELRPELTKAKKAERFLQKMQALLTAVHIPTSLKDYNVSVADLDALVSAGMDVQRLLTNNPRLITAQDARALYLQVL